MRGKTGYLLIALLLVAAVLVAVYLLFRPEELDLSGRMVPGSLPVPGSGDLSGDRGVVSEQRPTATVLDYAVDTEYTDREEMTPAVGKIHRIAEVSYGDLPGEVGRIDVPEVERQGPRSFAVDGQGRIYVCDSVNGVIQIINPSGQPGARIEAGPFLADVAVSEDGEVLVLDEVGGMLRCYGWEGEARGVIPVASRLLAEKDVLEISGREVYLRTRDQADCRVGRIESGLLVVSPAAESPVPGVREGGQSYTVRVAGEDRGELEVWGGDGAIIQRYDLDIPRLASLSLLGEDESANIYLQTEQIGSEGIGIDLGVLRLDPEGRVTGVIEEIPNDYANWTARLLQVNARGEIYQMLPAREAVYLNTWQWQ